VTQPLAQPLLTGVADFPVPVPPAQPGPARVVAVCNQKGGVGKTTTTINIGAALADDGFRVLVVDFDPQAALSVGLGVDAHNLERSIYHVLMDRSTTIEDVLQPTPVAGLDLVPASIDLSAAELLLVNEVAREHALARALAPVQPDYDVVLVDCQPSLGLLTVNALTAAHGVLVPLESEFFALRGVALLQDTIDRVRDRLNETLVLEGLVLTRFDGRTVHSRQVHERLVEAYGDAVLTTTIARTIRFPEASVQGLPITMHAPTSPAAEAYRRLARELAARWATA
jgi:chromosome partitioning protein